MAHIVFVNVPHRESTPARHLILRTSLIPVYAAPAPRDLAYYFVSLVDSRVYTLRLLLATSPPTSSRQLALANSHLQPAPITKVASAQP